jgi:thiamine pyrophosphate-dependent acetolactate synthase large subunit-like protein
LATAARARIPLVVFAGEPPMTWRSYEQDVDQAAFVAATGARYLPVRSASLLRFRVAEAFWRARLERCPVVLAVPFDLQSDDVGDVPSEPSSSYLPTADPRVPHPDRVETVADRVRGARRLVVVAGRGARGPGTREACAELAELWDGALATTLPARGLFANQPRCLGIAGGYAHVATREAFGSADLVVAVGASLTRFTSDSGRLFGPDDVVQIDESPQGLVHGQNTASDFLVSDALLGVRAVVDRLRATRSRNPGSGWDVGEYARRVRQEEADPTRFPVEPGTVDPRAVVRELDRLVPRTWTCVNSAGHAAYFAAHMHDRPVETFVTIREFGAVGNGLCYAIGAALARPDQPVLLTEGDGGLMMHLQELETVRRYGLRLLVCVLNDGAFGSELHRLRAEGLRPGGAVYGRNDIAAMARGFGLLGATVTDVDQLPGLVAEFSRADTTMVLDVQVGDRVMSPGMVRQVGGDWSGA